MPKYGVYSGHLQKSCNKGVFGLYLPENISRLVVMIFLMFG